MNELLESIRKVPDFPKPGILFFDITTLLQDLRLFRKTLDSLMEPYHKQGISKVCGIESRGFIFGSALADKLGAGFVPVRKPGKLPWKTHRQEYTLEYGSDALEIHIDAVGKGEKVLVVDDLLATGGTAQATVGLLKKCGADVVACAFVIELKELKGREKIAGTPIHSVISV